MMKKKIEMKKIENPKSRMVTFSKKRRKGLFKKAHEYASLSGAPIAVLVFFPASIPYTHNIPSFEAFADQFVNSNNTNQGECVEELEKWKRDLVELRGRVLSLLVEL